MSYMKESWFNLTYGDDNMNDDEDFDMYDDYYEHDDEYQDYGGSMLYDNYYEDDFDFRLEYNDDLWEDYRNTED